MPRDRQPPKKAPGEPAQERTEVSPPIPQAMSSEHPLPNALPGLMDLVINRDGYYPMHSLITSYLGIDDVRNVQLVCKKTSTLYTNMQKSQWNIKKSLQLFFKDTRAFRSTQSQTETIIGSEFAGKFFRRLQIKTELRLFTQAGDKVNTLISYLKKDGYVLKTTLSGNQENGFSKISLFKKATSSNGDKMLLALWHCIYAPIDAFLKGSLCSSRACFVSWDKAYCLFPSTTILKRTSYLMTPMSPARPTAATDAMNLESDEGFIVKTGAWLDDFVSKPDPEVGSARSIGDELSWIMELDTTDITPATAPDSILDDAHFSLDVCNRSSLVTYLQFRYDVVASCVLKHTYICFSQTHYTPAMERYSRRWYDYRGKLDHLKKILHSETVMQPTMLKSADRPPQYSNILQDRGRGFVAQGNFKVPPTWHYFDSDMQIQLRMITKALLDPEPEGIDED